MHDKLNHAGVKGMKWGVRKNPKVSNTKVTVKDKVQSLNRERQWGKVLKDIDGLSNDQIKGVAKRVGLENDLKRLSKQSPAASKKDKHDYINRGKMSDDELSQKVTRLRAKDALTRTVKDASKEQRQFGEKVVKVGGALAINYATTKSITSKDVFEALNSSGRPMKDKIIKDIVDESAKKLKQ